jgi:hypothetical protein
MPANTKITKVEESCFEGDVAGYQFFNRILIRRPVTLFGKGHMDDMHDILLNVHTVSHEIGHVQDYTNQQAVSEVTSQLNELEQQLMGFVVFSRQKNSQAESIRWLGSYANINDGLILDGLVPLIIIDLGFTYEGNLSKYDQPALFVLRRLLETRGDFGAIRRELSELSPSGLNDFVLKQAKEFMDQQLNNTHGKFLGIDLSLSLKTAFFEELQRRFGYNTAMSYFEAGSQVSPQWEMTVGAYMYDLKRRVSSSNVRVFGLEGLNCLTTILDNYTGSSPCEVQNDQCDIVEGNVIFRDSGKGNYCCVSIDGQKFRKWIVSSNLDVYYDLSEQPVTVKGEQWDAVVFNQITKKEEIGLNDPCR